MIQYGSTIAVFLSPNTWVRSRLVVLQVVTFGREAGTLSVPLTFNIMERASGTDSTTFQGAF